MTMRPVGTALVETTATVRSRSAVRRFFALAAPSRSKPRYRSMLPAGALLAAATGSRVMRRSEITGPPFCERPVWSRPETCRPSSSAAMPSIWFTVTTPVPPMPIIRTPKSCVVHEPARLGQLHVERRHLVLRLLARARRSGTRGSPPRGRRSPCCRRPGGSASCGRTRSPPGSPTGSGLLAAVAAALADALVDPDALASARRPCRACACGAARRRTPGRGSGRSRPRPGRAPAARCSSSLRSRTSAIGASSTPR